MAKRLPCVTLLLTLAAVGAHAQTVTLRACNPGKAEIDVYFAQGGNVVAQHVAPTYCATLAFSEGAMAPGLVAIGGPRCRYCGSCRRCNPRPPTPL